MREQWAIRTGLMIGSLVLSLGLAELAATLMAKGAYPYLNLFVSDPKLGVSLEPNATTRVTSKLGRITRIDTDANGRRIHPTGSGPTRVLLLGDSQSFGYLVEADETIAAELGRLTGAEVIDAAVPSYGPHEYVALAERLVPELQPDVVVFVANVANDWWEANADNSRRSTARDGWLAGVSGAKSEPIDFPGRRLLFARSHLVLAARRVAAHAGATFDPAVPTRLLRDIEQLSRPRGGHRSRLTPFLLSTRRVAEAHRARVIAVVLPLDVMVAPSEWKKYRLPARDLSPLEPLLEGFVADAREHRIPAIDLSAPLAGEPGVFLEDDPHLSARGHRIFAQAVAAEMSPELAGAVP